MEDKEKIAQGYDKAVELLNCCSTIHGFVATPTGADNYHRIWSRDGVILSLAALLTRNSKLIKTA